MIVIQDYVRVGKNEVIISVGYLQGGDIPLLDKTCPKYVIAYDPLPRVYEQYKEHEKKFKWFKGCDFGVGGISRDAFLKDRSTKSNLIEGNETDLKIKVVSISTVVTSIYERFGRIDKLLINCEGAEIEIIENTPMENFRLCKYIFVQFHPFMPELGIKDGEVKKCVHKLYSYYKVHRYEKTYYKYGFHRIRRR